MCEQTEINYLDGDVVWVKLGACWWPGQVTAFHNLPEDIQIEFQKKPLIAAVKFFQEDTYEFVKNLHQIYKYNCTQKDDFIRKGLDKYRTKSKDGSSYMDKFPGDVEMAEKLTGGDPDILTSEKFCREEKPDISALFGEKKIPKKKRDRDEMSRRSDGSAASRKITHPRFLRESDHEIRIRQQPSSLPSTPKTPSTGSPQFSCHLCSFTTTRVNVIICHRKSHCSGGGLDSPLGRGRIVSYAQPRSAGRPSLPADTQKRKYVRKTKSLSSKGKSERESEPVKRKLAKQTDKTAAKKKKTDPELREKLLADWDDETDEDMDLDLNKSADTVSIGSSSAGNNSAPPNNSSDNTGDKDDGAELIKASEQLLRETEKFASLHVDDSSSRASRHSSNKHLDDLDSETDTSTSTLAKDEKSPAYKKPKKLIASATEERKSTSSEKDEKQSRFSCFDFDEEDLPEPTITPVRKIPRIFGEKNTSVKKEILKKFTMSQAMKGVKDDEREEKTPRMQDFFDKKEPTAKEKSQEDVRDEKEITDRCTVEEERDNVKAKADVAAKSEETRDKSSKALAVTELEIVEIFEVEGEKDEREETDDSKKSMNYEIETFSIGALDKKSENERREAESGEISAAKNELAEDDEASQRDTDGQSEKKESMPEPVTTETEDETVSELAESLRGNSENSDTDGNLNQATWGGLVASATPETSRDETLTSVEKPAPRRRGRPRKSLPAVDSSGNGNESPKHEMIIGKKVAARDRERKTSESDSERSYSGRRRKPNKRYLHSDLLCTSSPDNRASKTDESQSETEEKSQKEHKLVRARGGKKKSANVGNDARVEPVEKTTDREFEFSNRTLATSDQAASTEDSQVFRTDEEISRVNELSVTTKFDSPEIEAESSATCPVEFGKKLDSGIGSPVNITKLLSPGEAEESSTKNLSSQDSGNEKSAQPEDKFSVIETVAMIPEDMALCADEAKSGSKYDVIKTSVDKLPPKKSQIKKFELSQIDLLDACEEQVAAEQAAAERRIAERLEAERLAAEKLAAEKLAEEEKLAAEKLAAEKLAAEELAAEKLAAEELAAEKLAAEKLAAEKLAAEKIAEEKLAAEKLAEEKLAAEKLAAEKLAAEKLAAEKLAAEKLAAEKLAAEKLAAEKLAAEKLVAEKLAAEKLEAERLAAEKLAEEKMAAEKLAAEELAAEKLAAEKQALERAAAEQVAAEQELAERAETEKLAQEEEDKKLAEEHRIAEEHEATEVKANIDSPDTEIKLQAVDSNTDALEKVEEEKTVSVAVVSEKEDSAPLETDSTNAGTVTDSTMETIEAVLARITRHEVIDKDKVTAEGKIADNARTSDTSNIDKSSTKGTIPVENEATQRSSSLSRYKGAKFPPEAGTRGRRTIADEEIPINSFQEAFLKTLHIDKKGEKDNEAEDSVARKAKQQQLVPSTESAEQQQTFVIAIAGGNNETLVAPASVQDTQTVQPLNAMTEFEGVEILVQDNIVEVEAKPDDPNANQMDLAATLVGTDLKHDSADALTLDLQKIQDTLSDSVSTPSPPSDIGVPVKKREKPRIIENVTLKEPMQILKNKLLEKLPGKSTKHKLDAEGQKKPETKGAPRAKMMKMDSGNGKTRSPTKTAGLHFTITKKLQVLKAEEAATAAAIEKEKATAQLTQTMSMPSGIEKFIQASSHSLADMELDINSMPFVLSEDVLTPESIEHMPVVISSIIPSASTSVPATLSLSTSGQLTATNSEVYKSTSETSTTESTSSTMKKKSGTPAILKNKAKAKPTITSIKTLVPPFAGGVKGLKFQSQQPTGGKALPIMSQKSATPGKYVIVQTAGGQQMRYSVQGKPGSQQKIAIPAGKATGSAQIVQRGGKVVILTSAQSGQTKMLPLNIAKSMSGKVQKIVNNKGQQMYAPMSPQAMTGQKTMIAPKTDPSSPTTSKLVQGQKILNTQGIITSKGVLTPISTSKSGLLGTLSQGILTKSGIYTPISTAQLAGKTIISGKTLVSKATTILSPLGSQALGASKGTIIAPMSHAITGKTIINAQGLVTPKGTVLTPITGQQVKAIAAKSPAKAAKIHYQPVQQKLQLPMLQKCQKIPMSPSTQQQQMRAASGIKSPSGGAIVFPNTASQKAAASPAGKKIIRQIGQHGVRSPQQQNTLQNASGQQVTQKSKSVGTTTPTVQRIMTSRGTGRQSKQKIVVQKIHESAADGSPIASAQQVKPIASLATQVGNATKTPIVGAHKQIPVKAGKSPKNVQKNLLNVVGTSSVATSTMGSNETSMVVSSVIPMPSSSSASALQNLPVPPLVIPGTELPLNEAEESPDIEKSRDSPPTRDGGKQEASTKSMTSSDPTLIEEPKLEATSSKMTPQPQIMALPTESSDGTQTYVLVTIDEQGQIQPLDNNTLMSLEGTTQNADGTRTLYIDPSSLGEAGTLDNIVLQFDNGAMPNLQSNSSAETSRGASGLVTAETFPASEIIQTSNQDILAAALANTDFQQEIGLPDNATGSVMSAGLTQTSLINQTILQSTIIPPTEPISSPSVLETSLTLNQPIMTPLEVPSSLPIQVDSAPPPASVISTIPTSLELPITITDPSISYITAAAVAATPSPTHVQIPGNSMPDIGEIMESTASDEVARTDVPTSTRYLVLPTIDDAVTMQSRDNNESSEETTVPVTYSVAIPDSIAMDNTQAQTTPSMPIIDDAYVETSEQSFAEVPINEMLVTKASAITDSAIAVSENNAEPIASRETPVTSVESEEKTAEAADTAVAEFSRIDSYTDLKATERMIVEPEDPAVLPATPVTSDEKDAESSAQMLIDEPSTEVIAACTPPATEPSHSSSSEMRVVDDAVEKVAIESTNSLTVESLGEEAAANAENSDSPIRENVASREEEEASSVHGEERTSASSRDSPRHDIVARIASADMDLDGGGVTTAVAEEAVAMEIYPSETPDRADTVEGSSRVATGQSRSSDNAEDRSEEATGAGQEEESPSQSYEQRFDDATARVASESPETPTQSATKSENSREPTQSLAYEAMEIDESTASGEPPTQSFEDAKRNEASQSYETTIESNTNAPTQSFNEIMQCQEEDDDEEPSTAADAIDDQSFPTQSYEVGKIDDLSENLESDASAIGQERANQPSQSNDIGNDAGIGTSTVSINNSGLNEDETASSSYVPETPENQERDQDQESAISTSSYEIPPCEELNIASSSVIPDTSVSRATEHMSIHDNGVPEIPTSSYNLNPDSSSTSRVGDALPTSSYEEDRVIVEHNVSTSYEVPISMPGIEENSSQNFVTDSTDHHRRNVEQPTSYYAHRHTEVTASYYEAVNQDSNSRLEADPQEEVTPSYYEQPRDVTSEASQSYFRATPRYPSQSVSPSYYDPTPETEASQSSYYSHEIGGNEQSSSRNVEASQSFYQESTEERRLGQQGEATPTYTERYPVDYALANSPMERHDLVESSVPATRPTER